MPAATGKTIPYSSGSDGAGTIDDTMQALAQWVDTSLTAMSTATRDALASALKWDGRRIFNLTTRRQEWWDDINSKWRTFGGDPGLALIFSVL